MALEGKTISRNCNYDFASGNSTNIMLGKAFPVGACQAFSIQITLNSLNALTTADIVLYISNDDVNYVETTEIISVAGNTQTSYILILTNPTAYTAVLFARLGIKNIVNTGKVLKAVFAAG